MGPCGNDRKRLPGIHPTARPLSRPARPHPFVILPLPCHSERREESLFSERGRRKKRLHVSCSTEGILSREFPREQRVFAGLIRDTKPNDLYGLGLGSFRPALKMAWATFSGVVPYILWIDRSSDGTHTFSPIFGVFSVILSTKESAVMEFTITHLVILSFLGFVVTIGTILYNEGKWKGTVKVALEKLAEEVAALTKKIDKEVATLTKRVDKIYEIFFERGVGKTLAPHSPLGLNDLGKKIAEELDLESLAESHTPVMKARTAKLNPYEIQQLCFEYVQNDLVAELREKSPEQFKEISLMAYKHGIPREDVLQIVGVLLRDRILTSMEYSDSDLGVK